MDMTPKSPEPEPETPNRIQPAKPISFSNGFLKHHHHQPILTTFKECLKNHAAATGGHALDGCGEFMPSPHSSPSDPTSLKCAACGCHRNFHRREPDDSAVPLTEYQPHHRHHPPPPPAPPLSPNSSSPLPISSSYMLLSLSGANKTGGNSVPFSDPPPRNSVPFSDPPQRNSVPFSDLNFSANTPGSRKRFRTKFSRDQKEKMHEFAERIGWKIQKRDEEDVHRFCREVGVERGVLKVWMHNNKNAVNNSRRDLSFSGGVTTVKNDDNKTEDDGGNVNGSSSTS